MLDLVDDDQTVQSLKRSHWLGKTAKADGAFEIEIVEAVGGDESARERRLAALTRPYKRDDPAASQGGADLRDGVRTTEHAAEATMKF